MTDSPTLAQRVEDQVANELVVWLTTTSADGTPQPNPVWFIPDGDDIIVYSHRTAARNRNIERNRRVSLNFNSDRHANHMTVLTGTIRVDTALPSAHKNPDYIAKYGDLIPGLGMTPETYGETYSVAFRITVDKIRGW